ncbi:MAG: mannose-6-phosphate isomerase, partial [Specibacter sp.]
MTQTDTKRKSNYDLAPVIRVPDAGARVWKGAAAVDELLAAAGRAAPDARTGPAAVVLDCYPGVDVDALAGEISHSHPHVTVIDVEKAAGLSSRELSAILAGELTDDRVFGHRSLRRVDSFYDAGRLADVRRDVAGRGQGEVLVLVGWGASVVAPPGAVTVLADMPRWEIQQRFRRGGGNWRADNGAEPDLAKFKRGYFVEWRAADEHKRSLLGSIDYLLDTTTGEWKLITGDTLRLGLHQATQQPFRVVPFFDPGPWGGTWMEEAFGLPPIENKNYAWCFDCVPEENSLLLEAGGERIEIPSLDLVLSHPRDLLGEKVFARFGAEFPIRFDFLDTVNGGNLSLQVHPLTDYIQRRFGMNYT